MKKKIKLNLLAISAAIAILGVACDNSIVLNPSSQNTPGTAVSQTAISQAKAKQIALLDSGVIEAETSFMRVDLNSDNSAFEVKFWGNSKAYEYIINSTTGDIEGLRHDAAVLSAVANGATMIDEATAKSVALKYTGLPENEVLFGEVKLENSTNRPKWSVKFSKNNLTYELEIDAYTSEVLSFEYDNSQYRAVNPTTTPSVTYIGESKAKEIAFGDAGISNTDSTLMKLVLNTRGERPVYNAEFSANHMAYAYKIDAQNGNILAYNSEAIGRTSTTNPTASQPTVQYIGEAKAREIALRHAGLNAANVTFLSGKLTNDDGITRYELEFYTNTTEYEYDIDAATGAIIKFDYDIQNFNLPGNSANTGNIGNNTGNGGTTTQNATIDAARAKQIALTDAGLSENQVTFYRQPYLEYDDGRQEYEVEFYSGNTEYDYTIDASNGRIISKDFDIENYNLNNGSAYQPNVSTPSSNTTITATRAKEIALADAGLTEGQVTFYRQPYLEYDDGRQEYEVEFYSGNTEYDYTIDASNGRIISKDFDIENYRPNTTYQPSGGNTGNQGGNASGASISVEQAKQIALQRAGVSASQAGFVSAELDYDNGRLEYEISFRVGRTEYDVTVNASTGAVIKFESDYDD